MTKGKQAPGPNDRLWGRLVAETIGLFAPGLGHARAMWERVREGHQADLLSDLAELRAAHARLIAANEALTRTVEAQQKTIAKLTEPRRSWFRR